MIEASRDYIHLVGETYPLPHPDVINMSDRATESGKGKKGKDVDLYSASHVLDTSNAHFVTETAPPSRYLGHRTACKHSPAQ